MSEEIQKESLLEFPCEFPIKVVGVGTSDFESWVVMVVRKHVPDLGEAAVRSNDSRTGKYRSVTVVVNATSQAQLDAIYQELSASERVVMAL